MSAGRLPITTRITLFTSAVAAVLSVLLAVSLMIAVDRFTAANLRAEVAAAGGRVALQVERGQIDFPLADRPHRNIQVVDAQGRIIATTPPLQGKPVMWRFVPDGRRAATSVVCGGAFPRGECDIVVAQRAHRQGGDWVVYSASPFVPPWRNIRLIAAVLGGAVLLVVIVTCLGRRTAAASLRPVTAIQTELDVINLTSPGQRVPVPPSRDEIQHLAESVNRTLERLETAMRQQRRFASDASHELRTPLAAMRAQVEDVLLAGESQEVVAVARSLLPSLDRLQAITTDLLALSRLDARAPADHRPIDLAELVDEELDLRGSAKDVVRRLDHGTEILGDRLQLSRLFGNLLDNAERHAATTVVVTVRAEPGDPGHPHGSAVAEVLDDGPGVPRDQREVVFQRFTRLDTARSRDVGGTGLGLPIAREIAKCHGGTLAIEDSPSGARFVLRLPLRTGE
ncbi:sensor histidine kinase [Microbispora sp. ATCC PTA-5024]|uniref:sensor histidine kinase n=1 Tax=Microbispora sp. ATCC PTA-5024 TaxID=316330 RepID=UPI0012ED5290|nr:HAMP domain-containing sensor histidine kinase [Microbispora sp. ATCC PTA-5024]